MEEYRICKVAYQIGGFPQLDGSPSICPAEYIERYAVQKHGILFWHTIKLFKKIRPAFRLLNHLKEKEE